MQVVIVGGWVGRLNEREGGRVGWGCGWMDEREGGWDSGGMDEREGGVGAVGGWMRGRWGWGGWQVVN